jgi:hypothetical protein
MRQLELYKYNPGQSSPEEREATFTAREDVLRLILKDLRAGLKSPTQQHFLLIGPRGIGKTMLLLMTSDAVKKDKRLRRGYLPLMTAEEEYSISSLRDLFEKILELLVEAEPGEALEAAAEQIKAETDDTQAAEHAIATIREFSKKDGRRLLLLIDNIDLILGNQISDDAQLGRLRDILQNESFLVLIAAAPTYFKEVSGYERPFYQFFHPIDLVDLKPAQMNTLMRKRAEWDKNDVILKGFDELKWRLDAVRHLTGGNPRLTLMLYQIYTQNELPEVRAALQMLLDDLTPYYKARLESLAIQQRKVMDVFARLGRPATPTELAAETRLPVNQINSVLKRLAEAGFVSVAPQKRRKTTYYMVSERIFRIWHQMRFSTAGRRRLEFLVEFIRIWYSPRQWRHETDRLLGEYRKTAEEGRLAEAGRFVEHLGYMAAGAQEAEWAYAVEDETVAACIESGDYDRAEQVLDERIREQTRARNKKRLGQNWFLKAWVSNKQDRREDEIAALEKAVEFDPKHDRALNAWGVALSNLALSKGGQERERLFTQVCAKYEAASRVKSDDHEVLHSWGDALATLALGQAGEERERLFTQACAKYEAALKLEPNDHGALNNWGLALSSLALAKADKEREHLLVTAVEKIEQALQCAVEQNAEKDMTFYSAHAAFVALLRCGLAVAADNLGFAREQFQAALDRFEQAAEEHRSEELTSFLEQMAREEDAGILAEFFETMRERGMEDELGVLTPYVRAVEYWRTDKDKEQVLDRLNPEVRELVEAILQGGKPGSPGESPQ